MMKSIWKKPLLLISIFTLLLGGCSQNMKVSAEEIIHNAIEAEKEVVDYYGKSEMKIFDGEELTEHAVLEEYVEGSTRKVVTTDQLLGHETVALNDGEKMVLYDEANQMAHEMDFTELGDMPGLNPKEQFTAMMDMVKDTHTYELVGEEELLDFDTYHIELRANEQDGLMGDMEIWVDQKTWFIVKFTSDAGDMRTELTYTELDFSPDFAEGTFSIDIPDDVEISDLEEDFGPDTTTLEEAAEALGQPFLVFPEEDAELTSVQMYDFSEQMDRHEVELTYNTKEGIPMFMISIFPTPEGMEIEASDVEVRGNPAQYEEMINSYTWDEEGLRYTLIVTNPDVSEEEVIEWTDNMTLHE